MQLKKQPSRDSRAVPGDVREWQSWAQAETCLPPRPEPLRPAQPHTWRVFSKTFAPPPQARRGPVLAHVSAARPGLCTVTCRGLPRGSQRETLQSAPPHTPAGPRVRACGAHGHLECRPSTASAASLTRAVRARASQCCVDAKWTLSGCSNSAELFLLQLTQKVATQRKY